MMPQQLQLQQPIEGTPLQQIPTFYTSNKFRTQSGLMGLLGNRSQKISDSLLSSKDDELKRLKREEGATDNAVPRSSYMCRKCRAHGRLIAVRQHKRNCPYKHCSCSVCSLVNYGRHIVARQIALYRDQKNHHTEDGGVGGRTRNGSTKSCAEKTDLEEEGPHCRRCRNHGKTNPWKGHKKVCPFYYCICQQCILITLRKSNEKNLREVVQESNKEMGLKAQRKQATDELSFPTSFYNRKAAKSSQEKRCLTENEEILPTCSVGCGLRWNSARDHEEIAPHSNITIPESETGILSTSAIANIQQENTFYNSQTHQAAAFAAAAAAAVAFQQETAVPSADSTIVLKQESQINSSSQLTHGFAVKSESAFGHRKMQTVHPWKDSQGTMDFVISGKAHSNQSEATIKSAQWMEYRLRLVSSHLDISNQVDPPWPGVKDNCYHTKLTMSPR
ncbi:doublesex and mab 3 transcription [Echinococcus multilocularis]|uniref:Doublesex and mab 3 transcription n=1 Tax=Echinococcus multilocularis TaxID=6211 RepID=A0A068Y7V1_ECHMU|nr:doublesex and mab 3 transcription [Echinococcus multilocularis]